METLLPALKEYLAEQNEAESPRRFAVIDIMSDVAMLHAANTNSVPALILWGDKYDLADGTVAGKRTQDLQIRARILGQSTNLDRVNLDVLRGVWALAAWVSDKLKANKRVVSASYPDGAADGLGDNYAVDDDEAYIYSNYARLYAGALVLRFMYRRWFRDDWSGPRNNDLT